VGVFCEQTSYHHPQYTHVHMLTQVEYAKHKCINSGSPLFLRLVRYFSSYALKTQGASYTCLRLGTTVLSKHRLLLLIANKKLTPPGEGVKRKKRPIYLLENMWQLSPTPILTFSLPYYTLMHSCTTSIN